MLNEIKHNLSLSDYNIIVDFIKTKYNYDFSVFSYGISKRRIEQFFSQYNIDNVEMITVFLSKEKIWTSFLDFYIIKTTELFRDADVWQKLNTKYIPKLHNTSILEIWLPDVTTDDELFSLLIVLRELKINNYRITISSPFNFIKEKINRYVISPKKYDASKQNYIKYNPKGNLDDFFVIRKINHKFKDEYFTNVEFKSFSLTENEILKNNFDLILFRNKMLYYNSVNQKLSLDKIYSSLKVKGVLVIGVKETLNDWKLKDKLTINDKELKFFIKKK